MRLTKKETTEMFDNLVKYYSTEKHMEAIEKLGQLEDIEKELGIDLSVLFKALKTGAYFRLLDYTKPTFKKIIIEPYHINIKKRYIDIRRDRLYDGFGNTGGHLYSFKDYGKTWALTKEELEK